MDNLRSCSARESVSIAAKGVELGAWTNDTHGGKGKSIGKASRGEAKQRNTRKGQRGGSAGTCMQKKRAKEKEIT